jgi:hypothetical protein
LATRSEFLARMAGLRASSPAAATAEVIRVAPQPPR